MSNRINVQNLLRLAGVAALSTSALALVACDDRNDPPTASDVGQSIDDAADDAADSIEDAMDNAGDAIDDTIDP